jgi:hypothetical protein
MQDHFRDADMQEYRRMQRDLGSLAKTCRNLQLKLKRTQHMRQQQKAKEKSDQSKTAILESDTGKVASATSTTEIANLPEPEPESGGELWKSAAIW